MDRYDRRELLLHVGEVLNLLHQAQHAHRPDALLDEVVGAHERGTLREILGKLTIASFRDRAVCAFRTWPKALLEPELDRNLLAEEVRDGLFSGNPQGWHEYLRDMQARVAWFGQSVEPPRAVESDEMADAVPSPAEEHSPPSPAPKEVETEARYALWPYKRTGS